MEGLLSSDGVLGADLPLLLGMRQMNLMNLVSISLAAHLHSLMVLVTGCFLVRQTQFLPESLS